MRSSSTVTRNAPQCDRCGSVFFMSSLTTACEDPLVHVLDNPVWHALTGPQQNVADTRSNASRYHADVAPFAALADDAGPSAWEELRDLVDAGGAAVLFVRPPQVPDGWDELFFIPTVQMVAST